MTGNGRWGLERLCNPAAGDWVRVAPLRPGFERMEAFFAGHGFEPHRHDTYAIGITLRGVQSFRYRGAARHGTPGQVFVLHPDETHDGHAGTPAGFQYRVLYVAPRQIQEALGGRCQPLPFLRDAVSGNQRLAAAIQAAFARQELDELRVDEWVLEIAEVLAAAAGQAPGRPPTAVHRRAVQMAREFLDAHLERVPASAELERVTGLSRYTLARHFRACLGTSPYRYLILRRLERGRALILAGVGLAEAALACGFADQSHLTRHFKKAYGLTPGRWTALASGRAAVGTLGS
ncbi:MAG TPA: AraC family transcriptional regulator, partial [bacterium]|nr:AraC family transcriptional regulator [bacterium]